MQNPLIYIVEDDRSIRELIAYSIKGGGYTLKEFSDADSMLLECKDKLPDLILMDVMLPGTDGVDATKRFRSSFSMAHTRIIMVSAKVDEIHKLQGLDAGADDYITKPFSVPEMLARVRANLRKVASSGTKGVLKENGIELCQDSRKVTVDGKLIKLTPKEFGMLKMLMQHVGSCLDRADLYKEVWGGDYFGERTVDMHLKNLREKLGSKKNCIISEHGVGYIMVRL